MEKKKKKGAASVEFTKIIKLCFLHLKLRFIVLEEKTYKIRARMHEFRLKNITNLIR